MSRAFPSLRVWPQNWKYVQGGMERFAVSRSCETARSEMRSVVWAWDNKLFVQSANPKQLCRPGQRCSRRQSTLRPEPWPGRSRRKSVTVPEAGASGHGCLCSPSCRVTWGPTLPMGCAAQRGSPAACPGSVTPAGAAQHTFRRRDNRGGAAGPGLLLPRLGRSGGH